MVAKETGIAVAVPPHNYYLCDHEWHFAGPLEKVMHKICMLDRKGQTTLEGFGRHDDHLLAAQGLWSGK